MSIDFPRALEIFQENISLFLYGIGNTLLFALIGTLVGFLVVFVLLKSTITIVLQ